MRLSLPEISGAVSEPASPPGTVDTLSTFPWTACSQALHIQKEPDVYFPKWPLQLHLLTPDHMYRKPKCLTYKFHLITSHISFYLKLSSPLIPAYQIHLSPATIASAIIFLGGGRVGDDGVGTTHFIALVGLEFIEISLPLLPGCWDKKYVPASMDQSLL